MLQTPTPSKTKRGSYNGHKLSENDKCNVAKCASTHDDQKACDLAFFVEYNLKPSTVRG